MGCDIHVHTEVKINGVWHHYGTPYISRSYSLFSRMANVRNSVKGSADYDEPISEPRGLPADVSFLTKFTSDDFDSDGHSHSWLSGEEMMGLEEWYKKQPWADKNRGFWGYETFGYCFGNGWHIAKYPDDYPQGVEDARVVFWFDN